MARAVKVTRSQLTVQGIDVEVLRKNVKYLRIAVSPPDGQVRVSAPRRVNDAYIRLAVTERLPWITKHREQMQSMAAESVQSLVTGESHLVEGSSYQLVIVPNVGRSYVELAGDQLLLHTSDESDAIFRKAVLDAWYRERLRATVPVLLAQWEPIMGVSVAHWGIRQMKTRWGSCNWATARISLNLELAKKNPDLLEYVVVHELTHLLERGHGPRFTALMDRFLPDWRARRTQLNASPPLT